LPISKKEFNATVVWMHENELEPGREYFIKHGSKMTTGHAQAIISKFDINTMEKQDSSQLAVNDIGIVDIVVDETLHFDPYQQNQGTGAFIIIDRLSNITVGAGMINHALDEKTHEYSAFELEFNTLVRKHFPHWGARDITK
jgi:sulfate adenylyltransferase subunit 1